MSAQHPTLQLEGVRKSFGAVVELSSCRLRVPGSIHALIDENGAGTSTLVNVLACVHRGDAGAFRFEGLDVDFSSTSGSKGAGISVIYH